MLDTAVSPKYLWLLMGIKKDPTYSDYMDQLHTLVHELKRVEAAEKGRPHTITHITSFPCPRPTPDHMDWKPTDVGLGLYGDSLSHVVGC